MNRSFKPVKVKIQTKARSDNEKSIPEKSSIFEYDLYTIKMNQFLDDLLEEALNDIEKLDDDILFW